MATPLRETAAYKALEKHYETARTWHMRDMFEKDPKRFDDFRCSSVAFSASSKLRWPCAILAALSFAFFLSLPLSSATVGTSEGDFFVDYSKNIVSEETMRLLFDLVRRASDSVRACVCRHDLHMLSTLLFIFLTAVVHLYCTVQYCTVLMHTYRYMIDLYIRTLRCMYVCSRNIYTVSDPWLCTPHHQQSQQCTATQASFCATCLSRLVPHGGIMGAC